MKLPTRKIRIANNKPLSDAEYDLCCRLIDIILAAAKSSPMNAAPTGKFWPSVGANTSNQRFLQKDRHSINHSVLLRTRFRDFPTIAYENHVIIAAPDYSVRRYVRLCEGVPDRWRLRIPPRFGEIGWDVASCPVNRHTMILQERINCLYLLGVLDTLDRLDRSAILEIGAGAGELGYFFGQSLPKCTWIDSDLPESLVHSATHLAVLLPDRQHFIYVGETPMPTGVDDNLLLRSPEDVAAVENAVISVPHFLLAELRAYLHVDLAFNAWSFGEMAAKTVENYVSILADVLGDSGLLAEQNFDLSALSGCDPKPIIAERFPFHTLASNYLRHPPSGGDVELWCANSTRLNDVVGLSKTDKILAMNKAREACAKSFDDMGDRRDVEFPVECWNDSAKFGLE